MMYKKLKIKYNINIRKKITETIEFIKKRWYNNEQRRNYVKKIYSKKF